MGSKIQARVGLRYEYSFLKAEYPDGAQSNFHKRLNDWVPSASVRYALTDAQSLKFSFSSNINRPGIHILNPAEEKTPNSLSYGNPGLNSSRIYNLSLEYNYITAKASWMGGIDHSFCNNQIGSLQFDQNGLAVSTYGDLLHDRSWTLWAYVQTALWRGATLGGGPNVFHTTMKDSQTGLTQSGWSSWNTINFTQKLPWKLTFGLNGGFAIGNEVKSIYSYSEPSHYWYASLSRSFLKEDRLSVRLSAGNLFDPKLKSFPSHTIQGDFRGTQTSLATQRHVGISISWRFGSLRGGVKSVDRTIKNNDIVGGISTGGGSKK
ncbi:TonB-dependent receptor [gut metagenome]|uniref:TonB-dependent receptor n=1 Tax=gut metagenome TaxID=749906 RepID=J9GNG7_9ZZZZ